MAQPDMTVGDIISITMRGKLNEQTTMNVLHYKLTSVGALLSFPSWASAASIKLNELGGIAALYADCLSEDVTNLQWLIQKISPVRLVQYVTDMAATEGTISEIALPPGVQASLTKRSLVAGRHAVGGIRMPGAPITANEGGYISTTYSNLLEILCVPLAAPLDSASIGVITPIIFNRLSPSTSVTVTSVTPEQTLRTIRRRVVGRGI